MLEINIKDSKQNIIHEEKLEAQLVDKKRCMETWKPEKEGGDLPLQQQPPCEKWV